MAGCRSPSHMVLRFSHFAVPGLCSQPYWSVASLQIRVFSSPHSRRPFWAHAPWSLRSGSSTRAARFVAFLFFRKASLAEVAARRGHAQAGRSSARISFRKGSQISAGSEFRSCWNYDSPGLGLAHTCEHMAVSTLASLRPTCKSSDRWDYPVLQSLTAWQYDYWPRYFRDLAGRSV